MFKNTRLLFLCLIPCFLYAEPLCYVDAQQTYYYDNSNPMENKLYIIRVWVEKSDSNNQKRITAEIITKPVEKSCREMVFPKEAQEIEREHRYTRKVSQDQTTARNFFHELNTYFYLPKNSKICRYKVEVVVEVDYEVECNVATEVVVAPQISQLALIDLDEIWQVKNGNLDIPYKEMSPEELSGHTKLTIPLFHPFFRSSNQERTVNTKPITPIIDKAKMTALKRMRLANPDNIEFQVITMHNWSDEFVKNKFEEFNIPLTAVTNKNLMKKRMHGITPEIQDDGTLKQKYIAYLKEFSSVKNQELILYDFNKIAVKKVNEGQCCSCTIF